MKSGREKTSGEATAPRRIQKYLSQLGVAARRQVEEALARGEIQVDGETARPGDQITPGKQTVTWRGQDYREVPSGELLTLALHKPRGILSSHSDPHDTETIIRLLPPQYQRRKWILAGRLDKDSEGLILLSEDGALVQKITHPSYRIPKTYEVWIDSISWSPEDGQALLQGIEDEGEFLQAAEVSFPRRIGDEVRLRIILQQGHKREIRRLMKSRKKRVNRLIRTHIGEIALGKLPPGECRPLTYQELETLRRARRSRVRGNPRP